MALVHTHKGRLPDARALLYEDTVDILLWRWEQIKAGGQTAAPPLRQLLLEAGCSEVDLKRVLWRLAYEAHAQLEPDSDGEKLAGIHEHRLLKALAELKCSDLNWGQAVADAMKQRAGLLLERAPEVFTFPHRTFQEYLAGAHLASQANFACRAAELAGQGAQWQEVILLAVGRLMYVAGDLDKPLALAGELCPSQPLPADPPAWRKAWLAGSVLLETGLARVQSSALGRDLLERLRLRLADLLAQGALAPGERARAGDTLAELGDPRFDPERWCLPKDDTLGFIEIPAGPFVMGTKHGTIPGLVQQYGGQRDWYEPETPQHTLNLAGYWLAKYPVTVAQYAAFMAAGGYAEPRYWPEAQAARCWSNGQFEGRYDPAPRIRPGDYGEPFSQPNRPVVGVTWYEALAYSRWLDEQLRAYSRTLQATSIFWQKLAAGELRITLPSEAEWEMAARDGDGREYPWGAKFDPHLTNTSEAGPGATSAVGCFPGGAGPYGALDLSGNVWEWTRSVFAKYPYQPDATREDLKAGSDRSRVVRGGSWRYHQRFARCAYRLGYYPLYRHRDVGFRLVAVRPL
jgi:formylglycine-generating enzyme required for sulfatase activity